jgi:hypothetical protein
MEPHTTTPALEAGFTTLRNAGLAGLPEFDAVELAQSALDAEWTALGLNERDLDEASRNWWVVEANGMLMVPYWEGLRDRARRAVERCILDLRKPVNAFDDRPVSDLPLNDIDFGASYAEEFIGVAARAADLPPEDIIRIVAEFCPIRDENHAAIYARFELNTYHRVPARSRNPLRDYEPEEIHREFLKDYAKALRRGCTEFAPWYLEAVEQSRKFFADDAVAANFNLEHEPGLLGDIARWTQTFAFRPVREFAQPAAIAVGGAIFGRRWATPTGLGLNLYQVAIGETGRGKDALLGAPKVLLGKAGLRHLIGPGDFSSDAALETSLRMHPSQLMPLDEFGKLAQAIWGRNAPSFARLAAKALLEIYPRSQPGSEWSGKQKADPIRDNAAEPVHAPTLSILGVSTPEGFFEGMSQQTLEDGFLNRLTLINAGPAGERQRDPARLTPPADLIHRLQETYAASAPAGNLAEAKARSASDEPMFQFARWADADAERAIEKVEAWEDAAADEGRRGVVGRAAEQTQKIATIRALFRHPAAPAVTAEDVRWAFDYVKSSIAAIEDGARAMMAGSEFERLCNDIVAALEKAGRKGLPMSYLLRAKGVAKSKPRDVEEALKRLSQTQQIFLNAGGPNRARIRSGDERIEDL